MIAFYEIPNNGSLQHFSHLQSTMHVYFYKQGIINQEEVNDDQEIQMREPR